MVHHVLFCTVIRFPIDHEFTGMPLTKWGMRFPEVLVIFSVIRQILKFVFFTLWFRSKARSHVSYEKKIYKEIIEQTKSFWHRHKMLSLFSYNENIYTCISYLHNYHVQEAAILISSRPVTLTCLFTHKLSNKMILQSSFSCSRFFNILAINKFNQICRLSLQLVNPSSFSI